MNPGSEALKPLIRNRNWSKLKAELDSTELTSDFAEGLLHQILLTDTMVRRRPGDDGIARDNFLNNLETYIRSRGLSQVAEDLNALHELFHRIDKGYVAIYEVAAKFPSASLTSLQRISGVFLAVDAGVRNIQSDIDDSLKNSQVLTPQRNVTSRDGETYDPASVFHGLSIAVGDIVLQEAYRSNFFDQDDKVVLPPIEPISNISTDSFQLDLFNARSWRVWKGIDERTRYLGGEIKALTAPLPDWVDRDRADLAAVEVAFEFEPNVAEELHDVLANERLDMRLTQNLGQMLQGTNLTDKVAKSGHPVPLPPQGLISIDEAHAGVMLGQTLALNPNITRAGTLLLSERLRGYAVLKHLVPTLEQQQGTYFPRISRQDILVELSRYGLSSQSAEVFLDSAMFGRSSRDIYDQPLIQCNDGKVLICGVSLLHANLFKIVQSSIANEGVSFSQKGSSFEESTISMLRKHGFNARNLKVKRGPTNAEYDYDVAFTWDNFVFFLECKNRSIPESNPIASYYFNLEMQSHLAQVKRLEQGLIDYPDILEKEFPDAVGKKPIFCVLHSLPFAKGLEKGIYFIDQSLLGRFFESSSFGVTRAPLHQSNSGSTSRTELLRIWSGSKPTVSDFLRYLENPPQLEIAAANYQVQTKFEWLSDKAIVKIVDIQRSELSHDEMAHAIANAFTIEREET